MANVWAVIRREYLQRVRSRWFIFSTVAGPLFMIGVMVVPALLASRSQKADRDIDVVDRTGVLYDRVTPKLEDAGFTVNRVAWTSDIVAELSQKVTDHDIGGFLLLDDATLTSGHAVYYGKSNPSPIRRLAIQSAVSRSALEKILDDRGLDVESLMGGGDLDVEVLSTGGAGMSDPRFATAYVGAFFLYFMLLIYSVSVMRATLEEKTSRVVEVVISSMKPWHLMLGKILGVGAVGLTQMAVWVLSALLVFSSGLTSLAATRPELSSMADVQRFVPGVGLFILFLGFFFFGFFMYSGLYAAVGAMCSTDEEAQQAQVPVTFLVIVPVMLLMPVIQNPTSTSSVVMSLIPFFSPILMFARVAGGGASAWEVALSFALMALAVMLVAWVAGRIYKVGILMAGKRPTLPELWRWVREA